MNFDGRQTTLDRTWTIALCASLVIHGCALVALVRGHIRELAAALRQPPLAQLDADEDLIYIEDPPAVKLHRRRMLVLGDLSGTGYAVNASPGEKLMHAREGPED